MALDKLLKDHGGLELGIRLTDTVFFSDIEFADDAALPSEDARTASQRLKHLLAKAGEESGLLSSIPKTKHSTS